MTGRRALVIPQRKPEMNVNDSSSPLTRASLIVTRCCLILSLWQAPIPWLHCHGTSVGERVSSIASARDFSTHLAVFHPAVDLNSDHDFGWHLHWILPSWSHALDDTPDDEPPSQERVAFDQATISPNDPIGSPSLFVAAILPMSRQPATPTVGILQASDPLLRPTAAYKSFSVLRC